MIKKFNKRQLLNQCGFTAEEVQIILDYQKKLPVLSQVNDGLCVTARDLFSQLSE